MTDVLGVDTWRSPRGVPVQLAYRPETSDWNTLSAILTHDEYDLPHGQSGVFLDVGAHIGGWSIGAALDNPDATVVAIEALPENVTLIRHNAKRAGVDVVVIHGGASCGTEPVTVAYGSTETDFARAHEFIGGGIWHDDASDRRTIDLDPVSLSSIVAEHGPVRLMKIDCEGCEWSFLDDPAIADVQEITGEYHPRQGLGPLRLREMLEPTHVVTLDDAEPFGPFRAVRR